MRTASTNNDFSQIVEDYLNRGFGSMNKNDFEVFIFGYLLRNKFKGVSDFDISQQLRIPQSKVKRLRYEASLKMGKTDFLNSFEEVIKKARIREGCKKISFVIEDITLRKYLDSILKSDGRFYDSSFNSEIVVLSKEDFVYLVDKLCEDHIKKDILDKTKKTSFIEIVSSFISEKGPGFVGKTIDLSITALSQWILIKYG